MAGLTQPIPSNAPAPAPQAPSQPSAADGGQTPPPAPQSVPGAQQPSQGSQPSGPPLTQGPVDPELLKKFNANCMNIVTAGLAQIIKMVSQSNDKVDALAHASVLTVIRVEDSLEQSGAALNLNMTFEGGAETVTDIADAMQKAGVHDYSQQELDAAFLRAVDQYRMIRQQQGRLDPAMFQQIIQQMKQAQSSGTLDQQFPGLTDYAKNAQKAAKPGYNPNGAAPAGDGEQEPPDDAGADADTPETNPSEADNAAPQAQGLGNNFPEHMLKGRDKSPAKAMPKGKAAAKGKPKKGGI